MSDGVAIMGCTCVLIQCLLSPGLGRPSPSDPRGDRRVAEGAGSVAVPGTNLFLRRYHATDAWRGAPVQHSWPQLERHNETHHQRSTCE